MGAVPGRYSTQASRANPVKALGTANVAAPSSSQENSPETSPPRPCPGIHAQMFQVPQFLKNNLKNKITLVGSKSTENYRDHFIDGMIKSVAGLQLPRGQNLRDGEHGRWSWRLQVGNRKE